ncbi:MAG: alpha/beta fold hydrolase [Gammaproteobacteria bacterium]
MAIPRLHAIEREVEDIAAVANAVGMCCVLGHSFGGPLALDAALRTAAISRLIIYESWAEPDEDMTLLPEFVVPMEALIAEGRYGESVEYGEAPDEIAELRTDPMRPGWVNATASFPREVRAIQQFWLADPARRRRRHQWRRRLRSGRLVRRPGRCCRPGHRPMHGRRGQHRVGWAELQV